MWKYIRIGVDIAKNCFQVHALESGRLFRHERQTEPFGDRQIPRRGRAVHDRHGGLRLGALIGRGGFARWATR